MKVSEIMTTDVVKASPEMTLQTAALLMKSRDVGALPVSLDGRLLGMVTDRDIVCRAISARRDPNATRVSEVMSDKPVFCRESEHVDDVAHLMEDRRIRRLPVLDEDDHIVGIVGIGDISHRSSRQLSGEVINVMTRHPVPCTQAS